ncbi:MAG: Rpn family recombination-promoting nuclease/putative transposase [Planctomycetaceae bacterium]|jgi:hypothetical protein|nr:Rpn family recombination-promoting nuclease/putative transposase [Planctomycetaceae bacterium]
MNAPDINEADKNETDKSDKPKAIRPGNIYDVFAKNIFGRVLVFIDFLLNYASLDFVDKIEIDKIYPLPTHYISKFLDEQILDLVFACPLKGDNSNIKAIIVFEHDGRSDADLSFRLLSYACCIWRNDINNKQPLSAIYFMVLRTGKKPQKKQYKNISDCLPKDRHGNIIGSEFNFQYEVIDLPAIDMEKLCGGAVLRLGMGVLKKMTEGLEGEFAEALRPLMEVADEREQINLTADMLDFIAKVFAARDKKLRLEEVNKALKPIFEERTKNMIPTIFDEVRAEARAAARAEGLVEGEIRGEIRGEIKGEIKARADEVIRVLSRRLEVPSKSTQKKIRSISNIDKLDELVEFAWTCVSVNEFATALN